MSKKWLTVVVLSLFLLKVFSISLTDFDLFGDEAQYWLWSKDLNFGYFSKPPLLAWLISVYSELFGDSFFSLKLLPILLYFCTALVVYDLSKNIGLDKNNAVCCSLIFLIIPGVSFSTFIISTDVLLLLFWTLSLNELIKIKNKQDTKSFLVLGVFLGLAFLSKYAAVYFVICLFIYIIIDNSFRRFFIKNYLGFLLSFVCAFVILFPNLIWNFKNGWVTLQHTSDNANFNNINVSFFRGVEFLLFQALMVGPFLFLGAMINLKNINFDKSHKILLVFSMPIFVIVSIEAVIVRANANWAAPALISFYLFLYITLKNGFIKKINILFNFVFCFVFFLLVGLSYQSSIFNRINGINEYAKNIMYDHLQGKISHLVVSDRLLYAGLSYQLRDEDVIFHMPYRDNSKITNHFMLSSPLKSNMNEDFILIGEPSEINYLKNIFKISKKETPNQKFTNSETPVYAINFK